MNKKENKNQTESYLSEETPVDSEDVLTIVAIFFPVTLSVSDCGSFCHSDVIHDIKYSVVTT